MEQNPYESPTEVGYYSPEDENERFKRYMTYMNIILGVFMLVVLALATLFVI
jgi:uncharacterized membrane protein